MISRIVFSGSGGQGIITAAIVFAEAAVYHEGLEATQTQSYGPEARGGAARSDVILATEPIRFPKVLQPNILVGLTQTAYDKYAWIVRPGGIVIIDSHSVKSRSRINARLAEMDFTGTVTERLGTKMPTNMAVIGSLAAIVDYMSLESLEKVIQTRFDERFRDLNMNALNLGFEMANSLKKERSFTVF
jgi:2-oxoglutarate ferredoxin oxidoreductase subunit gamma